jgi:hypothetical protein
MHFIYAPGTIKRPAKHTTSFEQYNSHTDISQYRQNVLD